MSRIGKIPIPIPSGVEVKAEADRVVIKGPKGRLETRVPASLQVKQAGGELQIVAGEGKRSRAYHGLVHRLITNMIQGVVEGFVIRLEIQGVGWRAHAEGRRIELHIGRSHPVIHMVPEGIDVETPNPTTIQVRGIDKQRVGQAAAEIRAHRPPEPYKGKGIRYANERVRRKVGKTGAK